MHLTVHANGNRDDQMSAAEEDGVSEEDVSVAEESVPQTVEEREQFWQGVRSYVLGLLSDRLTCMQLLRERELERKKAIAEGKMDDPLVPKRLDDAITIVGTCMDMCPRFERYRRERENNLDRWEVVRVSLFVYYVAPLYSRVGSQWCR